MKENKSKYVLDADKINVLIMGTSGAGKSTLINAIIPGANAPTGSGRAVTKEMKPYGEERNPLVLIDSVGYEYSIFKQMSLKRELDKWSQDGVKKNDSTKLIHMIWFCVDAQSRRMFYEVLDSIRNVAKTWKDVPIIVVFTKSYGTDEEDQDNIAMFKSVLDGYKHKNDLNIKNRNIIPVVAKEYKVSTGTIGIKGLDKLVARTRELIPEAKKVAESAVIDVELNLKKKEAMTWTVGASVTAGAIGAIPFDFHDATLLVPLQTGMLAKISNIYDIGDKSAASTIVESVMKVGGTTLVGKFVLGKLKNIPGIHVATSVLNAAVAAVITFVVGETSIIVFDKISRGELVISEDVDWLATVTDIFNSKLPDIASIAEKHLKDKDVKDIPAAIANIVAELFEKQKEEDKKKQIPAK